MKNKVVSKEAAIKDPETKIKHSESKFKYSNFEYGSHST